MLPAVKFTIQMIKMAGRTECLTASNGFAARAADGSNFFFSLPVLLTGIEGFEKSLGQ